jgi:hypothetical protein
VVDSSDPLVISSTNSAHNQTSSSTIRCVDPAATNVAIVGGNFFRKYRVALASRTLKGENFANFFRESGAPRANMRRTTKQGQAQSGALFLRRPCRDRWAGNFFRKYEVALAFRTLKGENFGNFFRESGAPRANMGRDAGRDETPLQLSKTASARKTFNPAT